MSLACGIMLSIPTVAMAEYCLNQVEAFLSHFFGVPVTGSCSSIKTM